MMVRPSACSLARARYCCDGFVSLVGVLEELKRRLPKGMAIVTGRPRGDCEYFLQKHG